MTNHVASYLQNKYVQNKCIKHEKTHHEIGGDELWNLHAIVGLKIEFFSSK